MVFRARRALLWRVKPVWWIMIPLGLVFSVTLMDAKDSTAVTRIAIDVVTQRVTPTAAE
jgi:hypothetical protein